MEVSSVSFKALPPFARQVSSKICAGRRPSFNELRALKKEGITQIVDLRSRGEFFSKIKERFYCLLLKLKYRSMPQKLKTSFFTKDDFNIANNFINKNQGRTYFHCASGRHRTGLMVEGLEILNGRKTLLEALESLRKNDFFVINRKKNNPQLLEIKKQVTQQRYEDFIKFFS